MDAWTLASAGPHYGSHGPPLQAKCIVHITSELRRALPQSGRALYGLIKVLQTLYVKESKYKAESVKRRAPLTQKRPLPSNREPV